MKQVLMNYPNKFKAIFLSRPSSMISVSVSINVGAQSETRSNSGMCHLIERLLRTAVIGEVNGFGGIVESSTDYESINITVSTLNCNLAKTITVLSNAIFDFSPRLEKIEREKIKIKNEIEKSKYNPFTFIDDITQSEMYKGTSLATNIIGSEKSIDGILIEDIRTFFANALTPSNLVISLVGDIGDRYEDVSVGITSATPDKDKTINNEDAQTLWGTPYDNLLADSKKYKITDNLNGVQGLVNQLFYSRSLKLTTKSHLKTAGYYSPNSRVYIFKPKSLNQTRFQISFPSAPYVSAGYKYSKLLETYLKFYIRSCMSKQTNMYGLEVSVTSFKSNAHLSISFAVDEEHAKEVYNKVIIAIMQVKKQGISQTEFSALKYMYATEVGMKHDNTKDLSQRFNKWLLLKSEMFNLSNEIKVVESLTYDNFMYIVNQILNFNKSVIVCAGKKMEDFNPYEVIGDAK